MKIASDTTLAATVLQENIKNIQASRSKLWREKNRILLDIYNRQSAPVAKLILLASWNFLSSDKERFYNEVEMLAKEIPAENPDMEILQAMKRNMQERDSAEHALAMGISTNFTRKSLSGEEYELHQVAAGAEFSIIKTYNVTGIPANFLLDKQGRIVGRNLRGEDLIKELQKRLGK